jgi:hypothetical protein
VFQQRLQIFSVDHYYTSKVDFESLPSNEVGSYYRLKILIPDVEITLLLRAANLLLHEVKSNTHLPTMKSNMRGLSLQTAVFFVPEMRIRCLCAQMTHDLPMLAAHTNTAPPPQAF